MPDIFVFLNHCSVYNQHYTLRDHQVANYYNFFFQCFLLGLSLQNWYFEQKKKKMKRQNHLMVRGPLSYWVPCGYKTTSLPMFLKVVEKLLEL